MSDQLKKEATYFFDCLFDSKISDELTELYVRAHQKFGQYLLLNERTTTLILERKLDPIALEFSSRERFKVIKNKLLLLCYLAESDGAYHHLFVNDEYRVIMAFLKMLYEVVKTPWLFLKGKFYIVRYGLV